MRTVILLAGTGGLFWLAFGFLLGSTSDEAFLNARAITLRTPISGFVAEQTLAHGTVISADTVLMTIRNPRVDDLRLRDLRQTEAELGLQIAALEQQQKQLQTTADDLAHRADRYRDHRVRQLQSKENMHKATLAAATASALEAEAALGRATRLSGKGIISDAQFDTVRRNAATARAAAKAAADDLEAISVELAAALDGTFIGDSFNDSPFSEQRHINLLIEMSQLRTEIELLRLQRLRLQQELVDEESRIALLKEAQVKAPSQAFVWSRTASIGESVVAGQELLTLADCSAALVLASVTPRVFNRLVRGQPVQFRPNGGGNAVAGRILQLLGSDSPGLGRDLVIAPPSRAEQRYWVLSNMDPAIGCEIGRSGRLIFDSSR